MFFSATVEINSYHTGNGEDNEHTVKQEYFERKDNCIREHHDDETKRDCTIEHEDNQLYNAGETNHLTEKVGREYIFEIKAR